MSSCARRRRDARASVAGGGAGGGGVRGPCAAAGGRGRRRAVASRVGSERRLASTNASERSNVSWLSSAAYRKLLSSGSSRASRAASRLPRRRRLSAGRAPPPRRAYHTLYITPRRRESTGAGAAARRGAHSIAFHTGLLAVTAEGLPRLIDCRRSVSCPPRHTRVAALLAAAGEARRARRAGPAQGRTESSQQNSSVVLARYCVKPDVRHSSLASGARGGPTPARRRSQLWRCLPGAQSRAARAERSWRTVGAAAGGRQAHRLLPAPTAQRRALRQPPSAQHRDRARRSAGSGLEGGFVWAVVSGYLLALQRKPNRFSKSASQLALARPIELRNAICGGAYLVRHQYAANRGLPTAAGRGGEAGALRLERP